MSAPSRDLVFLGPPGAGKGTQAALLSRDMGVAHISTGDLFRQNLQQATPVGLLAKGYMDQGLLVPDQVVCDMVRERLSEPDAHNGFILDGFPRTTAQAEVLERMLSDLGRGLRAVVSFEVPHEVLMERLTGRLTCRACGAVFHQTLNPPKTVGVCDSCGGADLYTRDDDRAEKVGARLVEYREKTAPLLSHYSKKGLLVQVDALQSIDDVRQALESLLSSS